MISDKNPYYGQGISAENWQRGYDGLRFIGYAGSVAERWFKEGEAARKEADAYRPPAYIRSSEQAALAVRNEQRENRLFEAAGMFKCGWRPDDLAKEASTPGKIRYAKAAQQCAWILWMTRADTASEDARKTPDADKHE